MRAAEEKVPGGKLVKVSVRDDGRVEITGDFFMHPEEGISLIEDALDRLDGTERAEEIVRRITALTAEADIELIGVDVPTIVRLYKRCLTCGE